MRQLDQWSTWQWALFTNVIAGIGIYLGFLSSSVKLSSGTQVYVAVPAIVFLNLVFLVVRPRMRELRAAGQSEPSAIGVIHRVLTERPWVTVLCILQLVGATRSAATTVQILQASTGEYVRSLPNSESMALRLNMFSMVMGSVALLWFLSAIGLWIERSWAWWLALVPNSLAAAVSGIIQVLKPRELFIDPWATLAVVLLLLRPVRLVFHRRDNLTQPSANG
jgi:hypothetical protein